MHGSELNFGSSDGAGTNTALLHATNDGGGDFSAALNNTESTISGNSYTVTATHTSADWGMAVVEIKPSAAPASSTYVGGHRMPMAILAQ